MLSYGTRGRVDPIRAIFSIAVEHLVCYIIDDVVDTMQRARVLSYIVHKISQLVFDL